MSTEYQDYCNANYGPMDVNSPEAALWSENMRLKSENEHMRAVASAMVSVFDKQKVWAKARVLRAALPYSEGDLRAEGMKAMDDLRAVAEGVALSAGQATNSPAPVAPETRDRPPE